MLIIHQIDAAYWHEWEMFLLPGGIQGFLLFNIVALPIVLFGYRQVILNTEKARLFSYVCGGLAVLTFIIHTVFFLLGYHQFNLPLSFTIIVFCLITGLVQIALTFKRDKGNDL